MKLTKMTENDVFVDLGSGKPTHTSEHLPTYVHTVLFIAVLPAVWCGVVWCSVYMMACVGTIYHIGILCITSPTVCGTHGTFAVYEGTYIPS